VHSIKPLNNDNEAYQKIIASLKRRRKGATVADISAATALPLSRVRDLLPKAADEFSGRLEVTGSGEILYSFPHGFNSRYRGLAAGLKRFAGKCASVIGAAGVFLFKVWIMVMLIGYFMLFVALAMASVVLSVAAQSKSSDRNRRGTVFFGPNLFSLLWRLWLYSELTKPRTGRYTGQSANRQKRPMHKAIFSFVFGEDDPNKGWEEREQKAVIAYIQGNRGVISLSEYMAFSGKNSVDSEEALMSFCAKFGGSPEATPEGTIVYRFDELLLRADSQNFAELSPPIQRLKQFSGNSKTMNAWFIIINAVNLIFGSYFLHHSIVTGMLVSDIQFRTASYLYGFTYALAKSITANPLPLISIGLGAAPLVFSLLFWLIPAVRRFLLAKENEGLKLANFKRLGFSKIWSRPLNVEQGTLEAKTAECRPRNLSAAQDRVIKEMGVISSPDVQMSPNGQAIYSFTELQREKQALEQYRLSLNPDRSALGKTVFDSGA